MSIQYSRQDALPVSPRRVRIAGMDNRERAKRALAFRERALAGQWTPRPTKIALLAVAIGLAMVIWGACLETGPVTIGIACFMSGAVLTLFCLTFKNVRLVRDAWPFTELVTDWNRVREIAGAETVNPPAPRTDPPADSD